MDSVSVFGEGGREEACPRRPDQKSCSQIPLRQLRRSFLLWITPCRDVFIRTGCLLRTSSPQSAVPKSGICPWSRTASRRTACSSTSESLFQQSNSSSFTACTLSSSSRWKSSSAEPRCAVLATGLQGSALSPLTSCGRRVLRVDFTSWS